MAFREVSRVEIVELIRRWQAGNGRVRELSRTTGLSRTTVQKYIQAAEQIGLYQGGPPPAEEQITALVQIGVAGPRRAARPSEDVLEPWSDRIQLWLKQDHLQLTRVHELLGQKECATSYTSLRRFVARKGWGSTGHDTVRMEDTKPGEVAEMDFGRLGMVWDSATERKRLAWTLIIVLSYSRHSFVWPMFRQQLGDIIEGLEAAWAFFPGIPRYLVLDNFPAAVAGPDPLNPRFTRGFLEYAQHRGFFADPARVRHPQDKPKVESGVRYVRERLFKGGSFCHMADLREQAKRWCLETAGQRVHGTTRRLPLVVFTEEERAKLLPWDGERYDVPDWHSAKVHPDHHIAYCYALYSVPYLSCRPGAEVEVRGDSKLVRVYDHGRLVKIHPRQHRGGRATDPEDYPPELTAYTTRAPDRLRRQAGDLGTSIGAFADQLLSGPLPWSKLRHGQKLLRLAERYTPARLDAACERALSVDLIDVRRVERILVEALEQETAPAEGQAATSPPPGRFARPGSAFTPGRAVAFPTGQPMNSETNYQGRMM